MWQSPAIVELLRLPVPEWVASFMEAPSILSDSGIVAAADTTQNVLECPF